MAPVTATIGASGTNAAPWTDAFLAAGWAVRNLVRDPDRHGPARPWPEKVSPGSSSSYSALNLVR
jgi:hypothetical protein